MKRVLNTIAYVLFLIIAVVIVSMIFSVIFKLVIIGVDLEFVLRWSLVIAILTVADVMLYNELDDEEGYEVKDDGNE